MKELEVKKGDLLQLPGSRDTKIYYVKAGLLRSYSIDHKGKEHIFMFAPEGWTIADSQSADQPGDLYIDALEDSLVIVREKDISLEKGNAPFFVKRLYVLQKRIIMLMSATALERYEHFVATYPDIMQRVPQRMIASYLGITPEALSKVKRSRLLE